MGGTVSAGNEHASPPCTADLEAQGDKELIASLAEAVHLHHLNQPEEWWLCEHNACRRAAAATDPATWAVRR